MMKNDRRIHKSKKGLKDALITLMAEKEFKKITVTDLVQKADLNRGTFYKHFQTKEELLEELTNDILDDLIRSYREPYIGIGELHIKDLTTSSVKIFEHVYQYESFYSVMIHSHALSGFQDKIISVLTQLSQEEIGFDHIPNAINHKLITNYHVYGLYGLIISWVKGGFKYSPTHMAEQLIEMLNYSSKLPIVNIKQKEARKP
ncbi:TetR/AcrR family transcriptional regulator [Cytobacillus sp. Sa5YUA1]|uniref:TetR/AcrR family transcriptional regulator n=2 Tax=Bacillaceae TaxID=186817 RepID=A0ABR8QRR9_9BACI|nr:TetR/AcrR family transcriptional regulator [Cytobacillus stercorigallinarum]